MILDLRPDESLLEAGVAREVFFDYFAFYSLVCMNECMYYPALVVHFFFI